jgi:CDP-diacylglycerol--glycerol-3-phosphate 3-phosphatidyltransferase
MLERFRGAWAKILRPIAALLLKRGVSPDLVTLLGTLGVVLGAVICFPRGWLWQGVVIITIFVFADMIDGQMAKISGRASSWGAFLDSSLDRFGDAAVFGGVLLFFAGIRDSVLWASVALAALVFGQVTSYVKARAESLGFTCGGGLAARADRLFLILLGALLAGLGLPYVLEAATALIGLGSFITVLQRVAQVRRQVKVVDVEPA